MMTPPSSRGNRKVNAWLANLPEITSKDAGDGGFVDPFTDEDGHNMRNYAVSRLLSSPWITLTIRHLEH